MRAARLVGPREIRVVEVAEPSPGRGEVLVRLRACGICASDLNAWRGVAGIEYPLPPGAPGHETWGEVVSAGDGAGHCTAGQLVTGLLLNGLAELGLARADHLVAHRYAPARRAAGVRDERPAVAPGAADLVAFVGFGYLAALCAELLPTGTRWIALSRRQTSRGRALRLGAEAAYTFEDVPPALWDSVPVVIEAAGVQQTLDFATWLTAYSGRLVIAGYHADGPRTVNMQSWNWKGIDVINAHDRQPQVFRPRVTRRPAASSPNDAWTLARCSPMSSGWTRPPRRSAPPRITHQASSRPSFGYEPDRARVCRRWLARRVAHQRAQLVHGLKLAGVQDARLETARDVGARYASPWFGQRFEDLLAVPGVDAVVICTPNALHVPQAIQALRAGKHVLVQKPLALSFADACRVVDAGRDARRLVFVDYSYRFLASVEAVHAALERIGRVRTVTAEFHNIYGPGAEKTWFFDRQLSGGGALLDLGVHLLDLALWLLQPAEVSLELADARPGGDRTRGTPAHAARPGCGLRPGGQLERAAA